jgi:Ca-activated chloride channel homolog
LLRFEHSWLLISLTAIPVMAMLYHLVLIWKKSTIKKIGDEKLVSQLIAGYSPKKFFLKFILIVTAFALTSLGVANLQSPSQVEQVQRQGVDVMIALDVSKSMLAEDVQPNRLERAKQLVNKLIDRLKNDRIGLVIFAGRAYLQMPLTTDHAAAKMYLNTATPAAVPTQGTVISEALTICNNAFGEKEKKFKTVVLITDGEDHDEQTLTVIKNLAENGVLLHTVGVGTAQGALLNDPVTGEPKKDAEGNVVISKLNEAFLQELSQASNGTYRLLENTDDAVKSILDQVNSMEQKAITDQSLINYRSFFQWFLVVALVLLVLDLFIAEKKRKVNPA